MTDEPRRSTPPQRTDWPEQTRGLVEIWQNIAEASGHIAHAKRTMYLAYIAEGFTEAQALELAKTI